MDNNKFFGPVSGLYQDAINNANKRFEQIVKDNDLTIDKLLNPLKYMKPLEVLDTFVGSVSYDLLSGITTSISGALAAGAQIFVDAYVDINKIVNATDFNQAKDAAGDALSRFGNNALTFVGATVAGGLGIGLEVLTLGQADTSFAQKYVKNLSVLNKQYTYYSTTGIPNPNANNTPFYTGNVLFDAAMMDEENPILKDAYNQEERYAKAYESRSESIEATIKMSLNFKKQFDTAIQDGLLAALGLKDKKELANTIFGDNVFYQQFSGILNSIGAILAAKSFAKISYNTGFVTAQQSAQLATAYFGAQVFGNAFERAIDDGASISDAYVFAYSNALIETAIENIGGIKLGVSQAVVPTTFQAFLRNGFEEGVEEVLSEFFTPGFDMYRGQKAIEQEGELPRLSEKDLFQRMFFAFSAGAISGGFFGATNQFLFNNTIEGRAFILRDAFKQDVNTVGKEKALKRLKLRIRQFVNALNSPSAQGVKLNKQGRAVLGTLTVAEKLQYVKNAGLGKIIDTEVARFDRLGKVSETFDETKLDEMLNDGYFSFRIRPDVILDETVFQPLYEGKRVKVEDYAANQAVQGENLNNRNVGESSDLPFRLTKRSELNAIGKFAFETVSKSNIPMAVVSSKYGDSATFAFYLNGVIFLNQDSNATPDQMRAEIRKHELIHLIAKKLPMMYDEILKEVQKIVSVEELVSFDPSIGFFINEKANIAKDFVAVLMEGKFLEHLNFALQDILETFGGNAKIRELNVIVKDTNRNPEIRQQAANRLRIITESIAARMSEEVVAYFVEMMVKDSKALTRVIEKQEPGLRSIFTQLAEVVRDFFEEKQFERVFRRAFPGSEEGVVSFETKEGEKKGVQFIGESRKIIKSIERKITEATKQIIETRSTLEYFYRDFFPTRETAAKFVNPTILKKYGNDLDLIFDSLSKAIELDPFTKVFAIKGDQYNIRDVFLGDFSAPANKTSPQKSGLQKFTENWKIDDGKVSEEIKGTTDVYVDKIYATLDSLLNELMTNMVISETERNKALDEISEIFKIKEKNPFYYANVLNLYFNYLESEINALTAKMGDISEEQLEESRKRLLAIKNRQSIVAIMRQEMEVLSLASVFSLSNGLSSYLTQNSIFSKNYEVSSFLKNFNVFVRPADAKQLYLPTIIATQVLGEDFLVSSEDVFISPNRYGTSDTFDRYGLGDIALFAEIIKKSNVLSQRANTGKEIILSVEVKRNILIAAEYSSINLQKNIAKKNIKLPTPVIQNNLPSVVLQKPSQFSNLKKATHAAISRLITFISGNMDKLPDFMQNIAMTNSGYITTDIKNPGGLLMEFNIEKELNTLAKPEDKDNFADIKRRAAEVFIHTFLEGTHINPSNNKKTYFGLDNYRYEVEVEYREETKGKNIVSNPVGISIYVYPTEKTINQYIQKLEEKAIRAGTQTGTTLIDSTKFGFINMQTITENKVAKDEFKNVMNVIIENVFPEIVKTEGSQPIVIRGTTTSIQDYIKQSNAKQGDFFIVTTAPYETGTHIDNITSAENLILTGFKVKLIDFNELLAQQVLIDEAKKRGDQKFGLYVIKVFDALSLPNGKANFYSPSKKQFIHDIKNNNVLVLNNEEQKIFQAISRKLSFFEINLYGLDFAKQGGGAYSFVQELEEHNKESSIDQAIFAFYMYRYLSKKIFNNNLIHNVLHFRSILDSLFKPTNKPEDIVSEAVLSKIGLKTEEYMSFLDFKMYALQTYTRYSAPSLSALGNLNLENYNYFYDITVEDTLLKDFEKVVVSKDSKILGINLDEHLKDIGAFDKETKQTLVFNKQDFLNAIDSAKKDLKNIFDFESPLIKKVFLEEKFYLNIQNSIDHIAANFTKEKNDYLENVEEKLYEEIGFIARIVDDAKARSIYESMDFVDSFNKAIDNWLMLQTDGGLSFRSLAESLGASGIPSLIEAIRYYLGKFNALEKGVKDNIETILQDGSKYGDYGLVYIFASFYNLDVFNTLIRKGKSKLTSKFLKMNPLASSKMTGYVFYFYGSLLRVINGKQLDSILLFYPMEHVASIIHYLYLKDNPENKTKDFSTNTLEYYYQKAIIDASFKELYELQQNIIVNAAHSIELIKQYGSLENAFASGEKFAKQASDLRNGSGILSAMLDVFGINQVKLSDKDFIIKPAKIYDDVKLGKNNVMPIFFDSLTRGFEKGYGFTDQDILNYLEELANNISKITPFNTKTEYSSQEIPSINLIDYSTTLNIGPANFITPYKPNIINISKEGELYTQNIDSKGRSLNANQVKAFKDIHTELRDEEGRIKSYWHGTGISFNEFSFSFMHKKFGATGQAYGPGFYFAQDQGYAAGYGGGSDVFAQTATGDAKRLSKKEADLLKEVYLIIKKPLVFEDRNELATTFFTPNEFTRIVEVLFKNKLKDGFIPELAKKMMFEHYNEFLLEQKVSGVIKTHSVEEPWTPAMLAEMLIKYSNGIAEEDQFDSTERKLLVPGIIMATMIRKWRTYVFANYLVGKKFDDGKGSKIDDFEKEIDKTIVRNKVEGVRGHFRLSYGYRHEMLIEQLMELYEKSEDIIFRNLNGVSIREVLESVTEATGYDGIVNETNREGHIVVAFSPKQVKSVDNLSPDATSSEIFDFNTDKKAEEIQKTINDLGFNEKNVAYVQPPVNSDDIQKFIEQAFRASPVVVSLLPATWIASAELQSLIEEDKKLIYIERLSKPVLMNPNRGSEERISTNAAIMVWVDKSDTRFAQYENLRIVKENKKRYATEDFTYRLLRNRNAEEDAKAFKKFTDENGNIDFDFAVPFRGDGVNYNQKITQDPNNKKTTSIPSNGKYIIIKASSPQALAILNKINFYNLAKNGNQLRGLGFSAEQLVEEYNRIKQDEADPFEPLDNGEVVFKRTSKKNQAPQQPKITKEEIKETFGNESVFREFVTFDDDGNMVIKAEDIRNAKAPNNEININGKTFSSRIYAVNIPYNNMAPLLVDRQYEKITKISEMNPFAKFLYQLLLNEKIPFVFFSGTSKKANLGVSYGQRVVFINSEKGFYELFDTLIHETTHELFKHEPKLLDAYAHELAMMLFAVDANTNKLELSEAGQLFFSLTSWGKAATTTLTAPQSAGFNSWIDYMVGQSAYKEFKKYININDMFYILRTPNAVLKADQDGAKKLSAKDEIIAQLSGILFADATLFKDMFNKVSDPTKVLMANIYTEMISNPNLSKNTKMYLRLSFEEYKETLRGYFKGLESLYPTQKLFTIGSINNFISSFTKGLFTTKKQLIERYTRERLNKKRGQATVVLDKLIFLASLLEKTAQAGTEYYKELKQDFTNLQTSALYLLNLENDALTKLGDIKVFARLAKVRAEAKKVANGIEKGTILIDRKGTGTAANTVVFTSVQDMEDKNYEMEEFFSNVLEALYDVAEAYNETPEQIQKMFGMKDNVAFQIDVANVVDLAQKMQDSFDKSGIINPSRFAFFSRLSNMLQEILDISRPYIELIDMLRKENFNASTPSPAQVQAGIISLRTKLEQSNIEILSMKFKQKINTAMNSMLTARLQKESPAGEAIQKLDVILKDMNSIINNDKLTSKEIGALLLEEVKKVFALAQSTFLANITGVTDAEAIKGLDKRWARFLDYAQIAMFQASLMARDVKLLEKTHLNTVPEQLNQLISLFGKDEFNPGQFSGGVAGMIDAFAKRYISTFAEDEKLTNDEYVAKLKKAMFDFMKGNPSFNNEILRLWQTLTPQDFLGALVDKFKGTGIDIFEKVYNLYLDSTTRAENIAADFHREYLDFIKKNKGIQEYSYETLVSINEDFLVNVPSGVFRVLTDEIEKETTAVKEAIELLKADLDNLKEQRNQLTIAKKDLQEKKKQLRRGSLAWIDLNDKQRKITARKSQLLIEIKNKKTVIDSEKESISRENLEQRLKTKILEYLAQNPLDQEKQKMNKGSIIALYLSVKREVEMMDIYEQAKELQEFTLVKPTNHFKFLNQVNILDNELLRKKGYEIALNSMLPFTIIATDKKALLEYLESLLDDPRDQIILEFMKKMFDRNYELLNEEYSKRFLEDLFRQPTYIPFTTPYSSYERDIKLALAGRYNLGMPDGLVAETTIGAQTFLKIENVFAILENHARSTAKYSYERFLTDWQNIIVNKATDKTTITDIFSGTGGNLLGKNNPFLRFFNQMMVDILAYSDLSETDIEKFMKQALRIYRGRTLFLNIGSALRQFGSIATILIKSRGWNRPLSIKDFVMNFTTIFGYRSKYLNFLMSKSGNFYFRVLFSNIPDLAKSIDTTLGIRAQNAIEKIIEFGAKPAGRADSDILIAAFKTIVDAIRQENPSLTEEEAMEEAVKPFERSVMLYGVANTNKAYRSHFSNSKTFFGQYSSKFQSENVLQWSAILRYWWELKNGVQGADRELLLSILSLFVSAIYGGLVGGAMTSILGYYNAEDDVVFETVFNEILWSGLIGSFPLINLFTSLLQFDKQTVIRAGFEPTLPGFGEISQVVNLLSTGLFYKDSGELNFRKVLKLFGEILAPLGIPLKNIERLVRLIFGIGSGLGLDFAREGMQWFMGQTDAQALTEAIKRGDKAAIEYFIEQTFENTVVQKEMLRLALSDKNIRFSFKNDTSFVVTDSEGNRKTFRIQPSVRSFYTQSTNTALRRLFQSGRYKAFSNQEKAKVAQRIINYFWNYMRDEVSDNRKRFSNTDIGELVARAIEYERKN